MINPVNPLSSVYAAGVQNPSQPSAAQQKAAPPQDTVQLSKAAGGDADHDGDSH
jgi:hypothetical protein